MSNAAFRHFLGKCLGVAVLACVIDIDCDHLAHFLLSASFSSCRSIHAISSFYYAFLLVFRELTSGRDVIPLTEASSTAAGTGVLRDEHRMPAHGSLLAVIRNICRGKPRPDEVLRVPFDCIHALIRDVLSVLVR